MAQLIQFSAGKLVVRPICRNVFYFIVRICIQWVKYINTLKQYTWYTCMWVSIFDKFVSGHVFFYRLLNSNADWIHCQTSACRPSPVEVTVWGYHSGFGRKQLVCNRIFNDIGPKVRRALWKHIYFFYCSLIRKIIQWNKHVLRQIKIKKVTFRWI